MPVPLHEKINDNYHKKRKKIENQENTHRKILVYFRHCFACR